MNTNSGNDNGAVTYGSGSVFKDLDVVISREDWDKLNERNKSNLPYPFADAVQFPAPPAKG